MTDVPTIALNNGVDIPQLGFGTWQIEPDQARDAVAAALEVGYRHIDTAEMYENEEGVGAAIRESGIPRDEIFVTSKLSNKFHDPDDALRAADESLAALGLDRMDLFLVHWPLPTKGDFVETWQAMEQIYRDGKARAIGVSNFQSHHLNRLFDATDVVPAVNQIEVHPYLTQDELRAFNSARGIATEAWSPIAQGKVVDDESVQRIASDVGKTPAQVVLRWHLQRGDIVFPKSVTRSRVEENFQVFDFELSETDMASISELNRDERLGPDPDSFDWIPG